MDERNTAGKIAALPRAIREELNRRLRENAPQCECVRWLNGLPEVQAVLAEKFEGKPINAKNMCIWCGEGNGFDEWQLTVKRTEAMSAQRQRAEYVVDQLAEKGEGSVTAANRQLMASALLEVLMTYDPQELKELMAEKPEKFFDVARAVLQQSDAESRVQEAELKLQKYRDEVAERNQRIEAEMAAANKTGGISGETLEKIRRELKLL